MRAYGRLKSSSLKSGSLKSSSLKSSSWKFSSWLMSVVLAAGLAACNRAAQDPEAAIGEDAVPLVQVATVRAADAAGRLRASGLVGYLRETPLAFKTPGVVDRILVDDGDVVRAGQRLAWLRPTEVAADVRQSEAALDTAQRDMDRARLLFDQGFVSQARLDAAGLAVARATAARDAARFTQATASLVAPSDGVVLRRLAEPDQVVGAGAPILLIGDARAGLILRVSAASAQAARVKLGDAAEVKITDGPALSGTVTRIAAKSDAATGAFDIEIALRDAGAARSGQVGLALIRATGAPSPASTIVEAPTQALLDARADQGVVFVVDAASIARRRAVITQGVSGDSVRITAGLSPGERVIAAGAAYVRDGQAVKVAPAS
jgi:RND family efflux transporter MFP subunit